MFGTKVNEKSLNKSVIIRINTKSYQFIKFIFY